MSRLASEPDERKGRNMYIGIGTIVLILLILLLVT
jgi:hypothetical protein